MAPRGDRDCSAIEYVSLMPDLAPAARQLCLEAIAEIFGFNYSPSWAYDLDGLGTAHDQYSIQNGGVFFVALQRGELLGAAGVRAFTTLKYLPEFVVQRYADPIKVGTLMRAYVRGDKRKQGIGSRLTDLCEKSACELGYRAIYLHTHRSFGLDPVSFWQSRSYAVILREDDEFGTVHMDKRL